MLPFDNFFSFPMIFSVYCTRNYLKHRPLYLKIVGAVMFRLILVFAGEYLLHTFFIQFSGGAILISTGVTTITTDEDDEVDPSRNPLVCSARSSSRHPLPGASCWQRRC